MDEGTGISAKAADGQVAADLYCAECGYNLRGLAVEGQCPECGCHIRYSLNPARRSLSPALRGRLARGLDLVFVGLVLSIVIGIVSFGLGAVLVQMGVGSTAFLALSGVWCTFWTAAILLIGARGFWLYGELPEGPAGPEALRWSRVVRYGMFAVMACVGATPLLWLAVGVGANYAVAATAAVSAVVLYGLCRHTRMLLPRLRLSALGWQLRVISVYMIVTSVSWLLGAALVSLVLLVDHAPPGQWVATVAVIGVILGGLVTLGQLFLTPVSLLWLLVILFVVRRRLGMRFGWGRAVVANEEAQGW